MTMSVPEIRFEPSGSYEEALSRAAGECGIDCEYWDIFHKRHETSSETQRRILQALGWDTATHEAIERERKRRFQVNLTSIVPATLVLSEMQKSAPVTLPARETASLCFEMLLEDGQRIAGSLETRQLRIIHCIFNADEQWVTYALDLPTEVPLGYHSLKLTINGRSAGKSRVIVCPDRAYIPDGLAQNGRTAGLNIALYGLRSNRNWGCGDFTDLKAMLEWARHEVGFSFVGLNPLHALHNRAPFNTSPYLPLSIYYRNPIYLDIEAVPEFRNSRRAQCLLESVRVQRTIRELREAEFVQYSEVDCLKRRFLKTLYREFRRQKSDGGQRNRLFAEYCEREGDLLQKYALYRTLDEALHRQDRKRWTWREWPAEYQSPDTEEARQFAREHPRSIEFHKYIQFLIDEQLSAAQAYAKQIGMPIGLYHDLAVATDRCGSDLWAHRRFYVNGCRVGAPPDDFSPKGQDWGFPPPDAEAHRESGYRLYRESIRKIVEHGGALRIDHVMRLFRLFWIPEGMEPWQGTYVRDHATDLMRILALESVLSKSVVIGEDLGTVTDEIRNMLGSFGILSYRLLYFEKDTQNSAFKHSYEYPERALVSSTTHDLPTLAGFWLSRDIEARRAAGLVDDAGYRNQLEDRKREKQRMLDILHSENLLPPHYPRSTEDIPELDGDLHNAVIGFLAQVPSMILLLNQEDFTKETEQQNLPGSTAQYPNWQRKMKAKIEDLRSPAWQGYANLFRDQLTRTGRR
jgi:4-alpha-glucanotransferase